MNYTTHKSVTKGKVLYEANLIFNEDIAKVTFEFTENTNIVVVQSISGKYSDLSYWLCQEPKAVNLLNLHPEKQLERINQLFTSFNIILGKVTYSKIELCFKNEINKSDINLLLSIIFPRFALREKIK